jgi:hypothetical protein
VGKLSKNLPAKSVEATFGLPNPLLRFTISPLLADRLASVSPYYTLQAKGRLLLVLENIARDGSSVSVPTNSPIGFVTKANIEEVLEMQKKRLMDHAQWTTTRPRAVLLGEAEKNRSGERTEASGSNARDMECLYTVDFN